MKVLVIFFKNSDGKGEPGSEMTILREGQDVNFLYNHTLHTNGKTEDDVLHATVVDSGNKVIPEFYLPCLVYDEISDSVKWDSAKMILLLAPSKKRAIKGFRYSVHESSRKGKRKRKANNRNQ